MDVAQSVVDADETAPLDDGDDDAPAELDARADALAEAPALELGDATALGLEEVSGLPSAAGEPLAPPGVEAVEQAARNSAVMGSDAIHVLLMPPGLATDVPVRHAWCICHGAVTSVDLVIRNDRGRRRAIAAALIAYGLIGLIVVALLAIALAPAMGAFDALDRSSADVRETLTTTRDAFDGFGASLADARRSAERAAVTARSSASTARQLANGMSVTIFGLQPLATLATSFVQEGKDLDALAVELDGLAASLARDETNVGALRAQVAILATRASLLGPTDVTSRIPFAPVFYALLAWLGAQAVAATVLGAALWRAPRTRRASGRTQHAA